jgi:hypothetical protein
MLPSHQTRPLTLTPEKGGETQPMGCVHRSRLTSDVSIEQSPERTVSFSLAASTLHCPVLNLVVRHFGAVLSCWAATPHFRTGRDDAAHPLWLSLLELDAQHRTSLASSFAIFLTDWWRIRDGDHGSPTAA